MKIEVTDKMLDCFHIANKQAILCRDIQKDNHAIILSKALTAAIEASDPIQELIKETEWQPIETMPYEERILICDKEGRIELAIKAKDNFIIGKGLIEKIAYWKPLPQPPKEEKR